MGSAWRPHLVRILPGVAIGILSVQLLLPGHPARSRVAMGDLILPAHPAFHHVTDPAPAPAPAAPVHPPVAPAGAGAPIARPAPVLGQRQLALINADRAATGLPPLAWSACLARVAAQNAARMASQGYISHTNGPTLDLACHFGLSAGENVGFTSAGQDDGRLNAMFMSSPEHRANILGPYRYVGVAWAIAPSGYAYIAVEFG